MPSKVTYRVTVTKFLWGFIPYPAMEDVQYWNFNPDRAVFTPRWFNSTLVTLYEDGKVYEGDSGRVWLTLFPVIYGKEVIEKYEPPEPQAASYYAVAPEMPGPKPSKPGLYDFKKEIPPKVGWTYTLKTE
jgi:hypothetical protein